MFKLITISAFLAVATAGSLRLTLDVPSGVQPRIFEDVLNKTLIELAATLAEQDPLTIPAVDLDLNNDAVTGELHIQDIVLSGFSGFVATDLKVNLLPPSVTIELLFTKFEIVAPVYTIDLQAVFVPFYGTGSISLLVENVDIKGSAAANFGEGTLGIADLKLQFHIPKTALQITGVLNNEELSAIVSTSTTECFSQFIENYSDRFSAILSPILEDLINGALTGKSAKQMMPIKGGQRNAIFKSGRTTINTRYQF